MNKITSILITIIVFAAAIFAINTAMTRVEKNECVNWAEQAKEAPGSYYILDWQYEQCEAVNRPLPEGFTRAK